MVGGKSQKSKGERILASSLKKLYAAAKTLRKNRNCAIPSGDVLLTTDLEWLRRGKEGTCLLCGRAPSRKEIHKGRRKSVGKGKAKVQARTCNFVKTAFHLIVYKNLEELIYMGIRDETKIKRETKVKRRGKINDGAMVWKIRSMSKLSLVRRDTCYTGVGRGRKERSNFRIHWLFPDAASLSFKRTWSNLNYSRPKTQ